MRFFLFPFSALLFPAWKKARKRTVRLCSHDRLPLPPRFFDGQKGGGGDSESSLVFDFVCVCVVAEYT